MIELSVCEKSSLESLPNILGLNLAGIERKQKLYLVKDSLKTCQFGILESNLASIKKSFEKPVNLLFIIKFD